MRTTRNRQRQFGWDRPPHWKDASPVPLRRLPAVTGGLVGAILGLATSALLMRRYPSTRPPISWFFRRSPGIRADGIPGLAGKPR
jgi:hypothetical protein